MAQFDVFRLRKGGVLVVDCQSELLAALNTRFVVPLFPKAAAPAPAHRLNPIFSILGEDHVLVTQFAAAASKRELEEKVTSLSGRGLEIIGALDVLISGV